ncbi:class I SAM-dependent methyltransferase [Porphyrobacter sp. TH134]|uniref:class I SAM-dependent methyltransferase n=1 Tax=Porphyrobacter sp. TH134 TaxID=2067450 RepID=UPI000C7BFA8C|nr:class I SAM-dependent methyltransferase [Porphyrobacter sp. TH134]PLK22347.1 class I SAM-dependent methyltransferase [Porphyrobacter sp. TH134]
MSQAEFDAYVDDYDAQHAASVKLSGEDPEFFAAYKAVETARIMERAGIVPRQIMDFGAGRGNCIAHLQREFPDAALTALDVSARSLTHCEARAIRPINAVCYDGRTLPFADASFDLVFTACVFHHIPASDHIRLLGEIRRTLTPQGRFVLFEHNPWNPLTRHAVATCPFDKNAVLITAPEMRRRFRAAGFTEVGLRWTMFFPAVLAPLRPLERGLGWLPLGAQYCLVAR